MKISQIFIWLLLGTLFTTHTIASPAAQIAGHTEASIIINSAEKTPSAAENSETETRPAKTKIKHILLQHIVLSQQAKVDLDKRVNTISTNPILLTTNANSLPSQVNIGMNNVPVLDQGKHGACATFATTAIIDAVYSKGDYISQLCNLELTDFLHPTTTDEHEGWDGSTNTLILDQIKKYGIISKTYQKAYGCGEMYEYPVDNLTMGKPMSDTLFTQHSEKILETMSTKTLFDVNIPSTTRTNLNTVLQNVKRALLNGHRVVIGFLLDDNNGGVGAFGKHIVQADSWVITPELKKNVLKHKITAGHAIIITAYDDNAVITGPNKTKYVGVLRLRNSWGEQAGSDGDYFMSYEYFKALTIEIIEVSPTA